MKANVTNSEARRQFSVRNSDFLMNAQSPHKWWSTLYLEFMSTGVRVYVAQSLNRDLGKVSEWCLHWGMKLHVRKNKTMIDSRSCTMRPQSPPLTIAEPCFRSLMTLICWEGHLIKSIVQDKL